MSAERRIPLDEALAIALERMEAGDDIEALVGVRRLMPSAPTLDGERRALIAAELAALDRSLAPARARTALLRRIGTWSALILMVLALLWAFDPRRDGGAHEGEGAADRTDVGGVLDTSANSADGHDRPSDGDSTSGIGNDQTSGQRATPAASGVFESETGIERTKAAAESEGRGDELNPPDAPSPPPDASEGTGDGGDGTINPLPETAPEMAPIPAPSESTIACPIEPASDRIFGRVVDSTDAPLAGVTILVFDADASAARFFGASDDNGCFAISGIPVGRFRVAVEDREGHADGIETSRPSLASKHVSLDGSRPPDQFELRVVDLP